jgi:hypothetical protein
MQMIIPSTLDYQPSQNIEIKGGPTTTEFPQRAKSQMLSIASRLFCHIFGKAQAIDFMPDELERVDVAYEELTASDWEALLVENGRIVGNTATIENGVVKPTKGELPSGYLHNWSD